MIEKNLLERADLAHPVSIKAFVLVKCVLFFPSTDILIKFNWGALSIL
jgi:hypothetical protein